jgi:hypothetical protein
LTITTIRADPKSAACTGIVPNAPTAAESIVAAISISLLTLHLPRCVQSVKA